MIIGRLPDARPTPRLSPAGSGTTSTTAGAGRRLPTETRRCAREQLADAGDAAPAVSTIGPAGLTTIAPSAVRSCSAVRAAASSATTLISKASVPATCDTPAVICSIAGGGPATARRTPFGPEFTASPTNIASTADSATVSATIRPTAVRVSACRSRPTTDRDRLAAAGGRDGTGRGRTTRNGVVRDCTGGAFSVGRRYAVGAPCRLRRGDFGRRAARCAHAPCWRRERPSRHAPLGSTWPRSLPRRIVRFAEHAP